ncbi:hypothetical protein PRZ48_008856 [Zasmidium cellare]|uniref:Uncharacterized protein n=1 Tax=Zasmidium cellare TaxID=395010 RepID=A0ABR0EGS4_ZASCE|nr:hypothetical protein PRZ48_008856 [Zasmidium cellare]
MKITLLATTVFASLATASRTEYGFCSAPGGACIVNNTPPGWPCTQYSCSRTNSACYVVFDDDGTFLEAECT